MLKRALIAAIFAVMTAVVVTSAMAPRQTAAPAAFTAEKVGGAINEIATLISREYFDPVVAEQLAASLRRRLAAGVYANVTTPGELAQQLTRELFVDAHDKHLVVTVVGAGDGREASSASESRFDTVRRTNGGVQRVEILAGNVGYLNLTAFWRIEEAGDAIKDAMRLLAHTDALIIDMRQNGGGSPDTVALLMGYLFDEGGLRLFDINPRSGDPSVYRTPLPVVAEHNGRRPMFVLTAARTFSAGEGFAFLLQERHRAVVVGERTPGAANPGQPYPVGSQLLVTIPNGQVRSAVGGGNWEGRGVVPDLAVAADDSFKTAHANALDALIRAADGEWRRRLEQARQALNVR